MQVSGSAEIDSTTVRGVQSNGIVCEKAEYAVVKHSKILGADGFESCGMSITDSNRVEILSTSIHHCSVGMKCRGAASSSSGQAQVKAKDLSLHHCNHGVSISAGATCHLFNSNLVLDDTEEPAQIGIVVRDCLPMDEPLP